MALNYVKGTISHKGELQQGTSQNGYDWARQMVVIETPSYNGSFTKIALTAQNQRVDDLMNYQIGDKVEVGYSVTAREYNGKWYNSVDLVNIKFMEEAAPAAAPAPRQAAPAAPRQVARPVRTTPVVPQDANLDPQDGDMPF